MRFQCELCQLAGGHVYRVNAIDLQEGQRRMADHWSETHGLGEGQPELVDIVGVLGLRPVSVHSTTNREKP